MGQRAHFTLRNGLAQLRPHSPSAPCLLLRLWALLRPEHGAGAPCTGPLRVSATQRSPPAWSWRPSPVGLLWPHDMTDPPEGPASSSWSGCGSLHMRRSVPRTGTPHAGATRPALEQQGCPQLLPVWLPPGEEREASVCCAWVRGIEGGPARKNGARRKERSYSWVFWSPLSRQDEFAHPNLTPASSLGISAQAEGGTCGPKAFLPSRAWRSAPRWEQC